MQWSKQGMSGPPRCPLSLTSASIRHTPGAMEAHQSKSPPTVTLRNINKHTLIASLLWQGHLFFSAVGVVSLCLK